MSKLPQEKRRIQECPQCHKTEVYFPGELDGPCWRCKKGTMRKRTAFDFEPSLQLILTRLTNEGESKISIIRRAIRLLDYMDKEARNGNHFELVTKEASKCDNCGGPISRKEVVLYPWR